MTQKFYRRRRVRAQQPQQATQIDPYWLGRGLRFVINPAVGLNNNGVGSLQNTGFITEITPDGIVFSGNSRAEFAPILPNASGLTLISVWRSRASSQYLSNDNTRVILSNRAAGNAGWTWGRSSAIGGGVTGNLTAQTFVINGVAQYFEANYTIESLIDTPVACRYSKANGLISWFRFGKKSSSDTAASTSPTTGGNVVFGAGGDYASNGTPWIDRALTTLGFVGELTDSEIAYLTSSVADVFKIFRAPDSRIWLPSAGAGLSISTTIGAADATGFSANVNLQRAIQAVIGSASAAGLAASVDLQRNVQGVIGQASASGYLAGVDLQRAIAATIAQAAASGYSASVTLAGALTIPASLAVATAGGSATNVNLTYSIASTLATAEASGYSASVNLAGALNIVASMAVASASGQTANINQQTEIACSNGVATAFAPSVTVTSGSSPLSPDQLAYVLQYIHDNLVIPTPTDIAAAVLAALNATTIPVNTTQVNGHTIYGTGLPPTITGGVITDAGDVFRTTP